MDVAAQVFDDPFRFGIRAFTEIGFEPKMRRELHVLRVRHNHVGDDACLQTRHAIGQHHGWHTAQFFEALGQQTQRRLARLVGAEPNEAVATPGQNGAKQFSAALFGPVDDQVLARHRNPGPIDASLAFPDGFGPGYRPPKIAA